MRDRIRRLNQKHKEQHARALIMRTITDLQEKEFAFTVTADAIPWDVYHSKIHSGELVTVALRITPEKQYEISVFSKGHLAEEIVSRKISESHQ